MDIKFLKRRIGTLDKIGTPSPKANFTESNWTKED